MFSRNVSNKINMGSIIFITVANLSTEKKKMIEPMLIILSKKKNILVAKKTVKFDYELIFFLSKIAAFKIRPQIVDPSEPTALTASKKASRFRERAPAALAMRANVSYEAIIFFFSPGSFVGVSLFATRGPAHF